MKTIKTVTLRKKLATALLAASLTGLTLTVAALSAPPARADGETTAAAEKKLDNSKDSKPSAESTDIPLSQSNQSARGFHIESSNNPREFEGQSAAGIVIGRF